MAYYLVNREMPITAYAREEKKNNPWIDLREHDEYKRIRIVHMVRFERELCHRFKNPFHKLLSHLVRLRDATFRAQAKDPNHKVSINYEELLLLIPQEFGVNSLIDSPPQKQNVRCNSEIIDDENNAFITGDLDCSNLSDLQLDRHHKSLEGVLLPESRLLNAHECFIDIKLQQADKNALNSSSLFSTP